MEGSKCIVFHWFYKVSRLGDHTMQKASVDNAFSMFLELFFAFWLKKSSKSICFIRYFDRISGHVQKLIFHWFYKVFRFRENAFSKPSLGNAFPIILERFSGIGPEKS